MNEDLKKFFKDVIVNVEDSIFILNGVSSNLKKNNIDIVDIENSISMLEDLMFNLETKVKELEELENEK